MDLNIVWYILVGVLLTGYAVLDGFDLGVGTLHLFVKKDEHRRLLLNSIGPVWDGNEVWLVTGGGALFAAFPEAYATVFSGLYLAFMLLLCALIFRAVAIEFRSKEPWGWWRKLWDTAFSLGSFVSALLIGVAMGNMVVGLPLTADHEYAGTFLSLLNPYALVVGITTVLLFVMHGAIYLAMKNDGELHDIVVGWIPRLIGFFITAYVVLNMLTLVFVPHVLKTVQSRPWILAIALVGVLVVMNIPREIHKGRRFNAFLSSCFGMIAMMATFGATSFPYMVYSNPNPENSLTIYNAASTEKTLGIMLIIALIGVPIVLAYTACIYWIFRGKTRLTGHSY